MEWIQVSFIKYSFTKYQVLQFSMPNIKFDNINIFNSYNIQHVFFKISQIEFWNEPEIKMKVFSFIQFAGFAVQCLTSSL